MAQLTAADGHTFDAYEVGEGDKALVVVQEIFGVNPHIRSVADRAAEAGYRVISPAFFDRVEQGVELGYDGDGMTAGISYAGKLNWDNTMADLAAAITHVRAQGATSVGITGFCWGGTTTWLAAAKADVQAAVGYYGGGIHSMIGETPKVPTMLHFGELDAHIPMDSVHEVAAAHP
jgi:carboxymethylenebutenolidase